MTAPRVLVVAAGLALACPATACKERGTISVDVTLPAACEAPTHVQVYLVRAATCDCADVDAGAEPCTACATVCAAGACTAGCDGGPCLIEELDRGLIATPPAPGQYAAIYQLLAAGLVVATACVVIEIDADGTESSSFDIEAYCCAAGV